MEDLTVKEAAERLDVHWWNLAYALRTRPEVRRRMAGRTMLVRLDDARTALADIRVKHDPYARRRDARLVVSN